MYYLCIKAWEPAQGRVVIACSAMREAEVSALVAQRVHAPLLVDVQSGRVVDGEGGLRGYERVGLVERPIARFVYRPERREVYEQLRHLRFIEYGAVDAVKGPVEDADDGNNAAADERKQK